MAQPIVREGKSAAELMGDALANLQRDGRVNPKDAATLLGLHYHTVREYIRLGFLDALYIGKRPWILPEELERYKRFGKRDLSQPDDGEENGYGEHTL